MLVVTMGDANGVGPEIILKAYDDGALKSDFTVVGDFDVMSRCAGEMKSGATLHKIGRTDEYKQGVLNIFDMNLLKADEVEPGRVSKDVAAASRAYIVKATEMARAGNFSAIVTLPVNKEGIRLSDGGFTGHTELIAGICGQDNYTMMLASPKLTVTHVSTHESMEQSVKNVKKARVLDVIKLTDEALGRFIESPRIAVAGLNAHAGEGGAFGRQEIEEIGPAVETAREQGVDAVGALPPDTVFLRASNGEFDAVVCMYHDQGHIPMKLLDFEGGVNVTLGLDVVRTSVDHGTAYDIAWQGKASTGSFIAAFDYAARMAKK
jgi:4-hydroxythreonine-4-phosphate dehydrogenase